MNPASRSPAYRFYLRVAPLILLIALAAWPSGVRDALSDLNAPATPMASSDAAPDSALDTVSDTSQQIQPRQPEPKAAASFHPCEDSLYSVWKKTPVKNLTTSELHDFMRRDAACKQAGSRSHNPNQGVGRISRARPSDSKPSNGFRTLAIAGAMATVISGAILISIDDECDGITDFLQTEDQCREEAEDARGIAGGFTLISAMVMLVGMVGGME